MKKILKVAGVCLALLLAYLIYFSQVRKRENVQINKTNDIYIRTKIFSKDSENRGYSDEAKALIDEDMAKLGNDPQLRTLYAKVKKMERIIILSKSPKEYKENFIKWSKPLDCFTSMSIQKYPNVDIKNFFERKGEEEIRIYNVNKVLSKQYMGRDSLEESQKRLNTLSRKFSCQ